MLRPREEESLAHKEPSFNFLKYSKKVTTFIFCISIELIHFAHTLSIILSPSFFY